MNFTFDGRCNLYHREHDQVGTEQGRTPFYNPGIRDRRPWQTSVTWLPVGACVVILDDRGRSPNSSDAEIEVDDDILENNRNAFTSVHFHPAVD